jgi:uncharacterized repeat protein (TIGR01451 family)
MNKQWRRYSREEKLTGKRVVQTPLQHLFFVVVMSIFWGESLEASQTRTWSVSGSAAQTSTGGGVTTVSVSAPGVQGSSSGWEIRGNNNVNAPNASSYSPNVIGDAGLELLFVPNGTNSRQITFTFSNPVTDPVLHMDRLGGQSSGITNSSAWTLNTTASNGATALQSVSGVDHFRVDAGNTRLVGSFNQTANSGWGGECRTSFQSGSACGSVRVLGTFTTLVFDVRMQGNVGAGDAVELLFTLNQDLGDAPSGYGRAMHAIGQNVNRYLGSVAPDDDPNGNEFSVLADNDDINGADDEDVINAATFVKGQTVSLPLPVVEPTTGSSFLNAWVDWNRNGVFENSERIASDAINNGAGDQDGNPATLTIDVSVPANAVSGETFSRFRWSTQSGLGATGATTGGEVEDHQVNVTMQPLSCDVGVSDSLQLSGSASRDVLTREITLTPDVGNQAGTAWSQNRISLLSAFSVEFSVYLGTKNTTGADGIAFAFQNDPAGNAATGIFGGALGVGGLNPAVAVEFDTYDNGSGYGDIANDHTAIYNPENYANSSGGGAASLYSSVEDLGNIEDGNWHTVQLNWDPASDQLQYFFDGNLTSTVNVDFVNTVFSGDPNVYFGFTASTGGSSNLQKICVTSAPPQVLVDYGDAPISFGEPSHILGSNLQLGDEVSPDALSYDDEDAAADSFDDGVIFPGALPNLTPIEVSVSGDDGYLQAWVDWNGDGVFDDPQERIATDLQDEDGDGIILVTAAPSGTVVEGDTYARFRWSSVQELDATEGAPDGEVEDYLITSRSVSLCEAGSSASGGGIASGGNGPFRDAIYWLDWNCLGKSVFQTSDVILKSWVYGPVEIRATVSDITAPIEPYVTGSWTGDLLDDLYVGVNPIGLGNFDNTNPSFRIDWEVFLQGDPISAEIIIADAEDTDNGESIISETNGGPWELFAVAPGTNDLQMRFENGGERMLLSSLPGNGVGSFLAMTQGVMTTRHTINTGGGQALAFGVFIQKDHGDIAGGYPESGGHFASRVAQGGGKPTADTDINNISLATLAAPEPYLGVIPPGPEEADQNSANADADGAEEEGVVFSSLVPGSNAALDIIVTETSAGQGYLQGWIDWNRDSDLNDAGEQVALNVRDNGPEDTNPAAGEIRLNVFVPPGAFVGDTYARFRFANAPDVPAGGLLVMGGEVEDYKVTVAPAATAGPLSGWVFEDNGVGATAHDGQKGPDEPGLANVPVTLYHDVDNNGQCSASDPVLAEATTDGDGAWQLVAALADVGKSACLVVATPNGLLSVSENSGSAGAGINTGAANDDVMSLTVPATGTVWDGILFGDAGLPILEPDQQGVVAPGGSRFYSHRFTARSAGNVDFVLEAPTTSPAAPAWNDALYRDDNCNGELDGADASLPLVGVNVTAGDRLCLLAKVFAPADAPVEALHSRPLSATQTYTGTAFQATAQVTDTTRLAAGQLQLEKQVRNIGPDGIANTGDDVDATDTTANQAAPGDVLRYRLIFRNQGSNPLTEVIVTDSTPAYSALNAAATCPAALPAALSACALSAPDGSNGSGYQGGLQWQFTGELQPGGQGAVSYDVRVSQD